MEVTGADRSITSGTYEAAARHEDQQKRPRDRQVNDCAVVQYGLALSYRNPIRTDQLLVTEEHNRRHRKRKQNRNTSTSVG